MNRVAKKKRKKLANFLTIVRQMAFYAVTVCLLDRGAPALSESATHNKQDMRDLKEEAWGGSHKKTITSLQGDGEV